MPQPSLAIVLGDVTVRQHDGLFSLNDLHRASGGEKRHQPSDFLRIEQTQALIAEINSADSRSLETADIPAVKTREGRNGGTYACRELVIAYAAWINAAFHLKVIRVFLAAVAPTTPYAVLPGQTLSAEQAQTLRDMLTTAVKRLPHDKQAGAMVKGWSKLKAHFGTDYRHIPAGEFAEALSIIARHVAESALTDEAPTLRNRRWLIATDHEGRETVQAVGPHDFISNWADLTRGIADGDLLPSTSELIDLATACMQRVQRRPAIYRRSDVPGVLNPV